MIFSLVAIAVMPPQVLGFTEEPEEKEQFKLRRSKRHCVTQNKKVRFGKEIFI